MVKLGDAIATVATPIARALDLPCIDPATNDLRPDSPCARRKQKLNDLSDALFDAFWPTQPTRKEN